LSITPGKFSFFEKITDCEKATYTFINDIEEGKNVKVTKVQGGSGEQGAEEEEEEFSMEAIQRRRQAAKRAQEEAERAKQEALDKAEQEKLAKLAQIGGADRAWQVGDECLAFYYPDQKFYKAKIRQIPKKPKGGSKKKGEEGKQSKKDQEKSLEDALMGGLICITYSGYGNSVRLHPNQILPVLGEGTAPTKEQRQVAWDIHLQQAAINKKKKIAKKEAMQKKKRQERAARRR